MSNSNAQRDGLFWQLLSYLGSYFDVLKSRTNGVIIAGFLAYFFSKFGVAIDTEAAGTAISEAATQAGAVPMTAQDLIVFAVTVLAVYFRSNPRTSFRKVEVVTPPQTDTPPAQQ